MVGIRKKECLQKVLSLKIQRLQYYVNNPVRSSLTLQCIILIINIGRKSVIVSFWGKIGFNVQSSSSLLLNQHSTRNTFPKGKFFPGSNYNLTRLGIATVTTGIFDKTLLMKNIQNKCFIPKSVALFLSILCSF